MPLIGPTDPRIVFLLAATTVSAMSVSAGPAVTLPVVQPYHDLATSDINPALAAVRAGMTTCVLGFVVASPADGRTPAWGTAGPANGRTFSNEVARLRDSLHHLAVSFGGAEHTDLAAIDQSPDRLASTYERVCSAYRFAAVDFDVEGVALLDRAGMARRAEAWKIWRASSSRSCASATQGVNIATTIATTNIALGSVMNPPRVSHQRIGVQPSSILGRAHQSGSRAAPVS